MFKLMKKISKSASYGLSGVLNTFKTELMMRVQFSFGLIQFILSLLFKFEITQIVIILIVWIMLISQEVSNTAIERLTDLVVGEKRNQLAKEAKDCAAGSVVLISILSWFVFIMFLIQNII